MCSEAYLRSSSLARPESSRHPTPCPALLQIFCTGEASKRLKDSQDGGMDLQAYIEFRRNFRCGRELACACLCLRESRPFGCMVRGRLGTDR